jgi:rhodanese-related sulfurtransferase
MPFEKFHEIMTGSFQVRPNNFAVMVNKNRKGPAYLSQVPPFNSMSLLEVERALQQGAKIVDTRVPSAFGAAFIPGAINIGLTPASVNWLGMVLAADNDIIVIAETSDKAHEAAYIYRRAGYDQLIGYLEGGVTDWAAQAKPLDHLPQLTPSSLQHVLDKYKDHMVVDVRTALEWEDGHIENAIHLPIEKIIKKEFDLDKKRHITVVCGSGYRSNISGSIFKSLGYEYVFSLIGGMTAWNAMNNYKNSL